MGAVAQGESGVRLLGGCRVGGPLRAPVGVTVACRDADGWHVRTGRVEGAPPPDRAGVAPTALWHSVPKR
ncbi:hypothetical protein SAMN05216207_1007164 [Pseudonocardia ammonioxydans]|uniref:Uncharacterized protein n=1 Tax=Pseudonocardia ammonioxydans TaxID=260086 RepID=A0A1I4W3A7_PSUAM|nr:hypothetical protein SAMN05216207_1007164 [Pseudonocardia ammonioxydans]